MNAPDGLWRQWSAQLRAFLPEIHGHRSKTLAFVVLGVVLAGSTRLPRVAETLGGISAAKTPSIERRLARFLANQQVAVLPLWTHLLSQFLTFWRERRLVFVLDATALDDRATVLYLGLLVHSRLLPVGAAGGASPRDMGAAAVGGGRRAAGPRHPPPGSRRLHAAGRSRPGRASAGAAVSAAWLALRAPRVCCTHLPAHAWARGARLDPVPSPGLGSADVSGTALSGSGRSAHWRPRSVRPGSPSERSRGSSSLTGPRDGSACASMPAECASNRPFKI